MYPKARKDVTHTVRNKNSKITQSSRIMGEEGKGSAFCFNLTVWNYLIAVLRLVLGFGWQRIIPILTCPSCVVWMPNYACT